MPTASTPISASRLSFSPVNWSQVERGVRPGKGRRALHWAMLEWSSGPRGSPSSAAFTDHCHFERTLGKGSQKFGLSLGQMNPRGPVLGTEHDDLPVVIGRHVRTRRRGQHRERRRLIALSRPRNGGNCANRRTAQRKPVLRLWVPLAGELEEGRRWHNAPGAVAEDAEKSADYIGEMLIELIPMAKAGELPPALGHFLEMAKPKADDHLGQFAITKRTLKRE
jgi:hypothetical protein